MYAMYSISNTILNSLLWRIKYCYHLTKLWACDAVELQLKAADLSRSASNERHPRQTNAIRVKTNAIRVRSDAASKWRGVKKFAAWSGYILRCSVLIFNVFSGKFLFGMFRSKCILQMFLKYLKKYHFCSCRKKYPSTSVPSTTYWWGFWPRTSRG